MDVRVGTTGVKGIKDVRGSTTGVKGRDGWSRE